MTQQEQRQPQAQTQIKTQEVKRPLTEFEQLLERDFKFKQEYVPFLGEEDQKIVLSPQIVKRYFVKPTKEGHICTDEHAVRFIQLCRMRKLNVWEGDAFLVGYDTQNGPEFSLITAHQAFLKRAESHPAFEGQQSGVTVVDESSGQIQDIEGDFVPADCILVGGWSKTYRKDRKYHTYRRLPLTAYAKNFGVWKTNPSGMIVKCAEADGFRSTFPNILGGMYVAGEMQDAEIASAEPEPAPAKMNLRQQARKRIDPSPPVGAADPINAPAGIADPSLTGAATPPSNAAPVPEKAGIPGKPVIGTDDITDPQSVIAPGHEGEAARSGRPWPNPVAAQVMAQSVSEPSPVATGDKASIEDRAQAYADLPIADLRAKLKAISVGQSRQKEFIKHAKAKHNVAILDEDVPEDVIRAIAFTYEKTRLEATP